MAALEVSREGAVAILTMNRPGQLNALDETMAEGFAAAITQIRADTSLRAVVLTGAGGAFCAGGDVKAMGRASKDGTGENGTRTYLAALYRWFEQLVDLEKPVVAAVDGVAFGAGLSLALAADFIFLSPRARLCAVFARMGLVPDLGGLHLLPRRIGVPMAKELAFTTRIVHAPEAVQIGLADSVIEGDVLAGAIAFAARFETAPPLAIGLMKSILNNSLENSPQNTYAQEISAQSLCAQSQYFRTALEDFLQKRPSRFGWDGL